MPAGTEPLGIITDPNAAVCATILPKLLNLYSSYCAADDESPGRGRFPTLPPNYWVNYCAYLNTLLEAWQNFCQSVNLAK